MTLTRLEEWEKDLRTLVEGLDIFLENTYGKEFPLRSNRPPRGKTANSKYDGLFSIDAKYTLGIGSEHGEGYMLDLRMATFSKVPEEVREKIVQDSFNYLKEKINTVFPDLDVRVGREGDNIKIFGNLRLD